MILLCLVLSLAFLCTGLLFGGHLVIPQFNFWWKLTLHVKLEKVKVVECGGVGGLPFHSIQNASKDSAFFPFLSAHRGVLLETVLFMNERALGKHLYTPLVYRSALPWQSHRPICVMTMMGVASL